jgi:hypothetical protein
MNPNIRKTLLSLQCLGLNLNTGVSCIITLSSLEAMTGIRQNSNGSRIIRRDCKLFSKFKIEYFYSEKGEVAGYKFNGYKTSTDLITEASEAIIHYKDKLEQTFLLLEKAELEARHLISCDYFEYDVSDIISL